MFIGHLGVAFGLKRDAPRVSLGTLFMAAQFVDLLWPLFLLLGWERVAIVPGITRVTPLDFELYPITHSLVGAVGWMLVFAAVYWLIKKYPRGAVVCGLAVFSHWILDFVSHRPDLPLYPGGGPKVGLELWNSLPATLIVELALFGVGIWLYLRCTRARDRIGSLGLWVFIVVLLLMYLGNIFGAPPPNTAVIAWLGQGQWLLVAWAYWIDRHRVAGAPAHTPKLA
jgi:membrane-bound metal-dependent hydrolase YbcI (DUF457 family)